MADIYLTSDTHFGDHNIVTYEQRPFQTISEMDETLINNWNAVVKPQDTVFHLGDVCVYAKEKASKIIHELNGKKILILGNHDMQLSVREWMECGFEEAYSYPILYQEYFVLQHEPPQYINNMTPFFYFYGHVHQTKMYPTVAERSACVCTERWKYAPVSLEQIKKLVTELLTNSPIEQ